MPPPADVHSIHAYFPSVVTLDNGEMLATVVLGEAFEAPNLSTHVCRSKDGGKTWTAPQSTGLMGQTLTPYLLEDGRILCVYRRMDKPGLWANFAHLNGDQWVNDCEFPLWGTQTRGLTRRSKNMAQNFNVLKFGAPSITRAPDGKIFVAFWGYEEGVSVIRWFKLSI